MKIRQYSWQPELSSYDNLCLAIGKMEDDKILNEKLDYKEPNQHVLMNAAGTKVFVALDGMKKSDVYKHLMGSFRGVNKSNESII